MTVDGFAGGVGSAMELCLDGPVEQHLCGALHNIGFSQLAFGAAESHLAASSSRSPGNEDVFFEAAWRAQAWQRTSARECPARHGVQAGYHNSLFEALKALASVEHAGRKQSSHNYDDASRARTTMILGRVQQHIQKARSVALAAFQSMCDSQSTKYSQAQLVRLQMCEDVEGLAQELLRVDAGTALPSPSQSRGAFGSSSRNPSSSRKAAVETICNIWHRRYDKLDSEFALCEPLISLHAILLRLSPHPELLEKHMCLAAKVAMKQGNMSFARGSMQKLQMWAASQSDAQGQGHPRAWWIRDAKVLVSVLLPAGCCSLALARLLLPACS